MFFRKFYMSRFSVYHEYVSRDYHAQHVTQMLYHKIYIWKAVLRCVGEDVSAKWTTLWRISDNVDTSMVFRQYELGNVYLNCSTGRIFFRKFCKHAVGTFDVRAEYVYEGDPSSQMNVDKDGKGIFCRPCQHIGCILNASRDSTRMRISFHILYTENCPLQQLENKKNNV